MNYCLDISAAPYGTGVSRYTTNLAQKLGSITANEDTFSIFGGSLRQFTELNRFAQSCKTKPKYLYPLPPRALSYLFNNLNFSIDPLIGKEDIFHSWDWYLPKSKKSTVVTTVHDLALFKFPSIAHPHIKDHHSRVMKRIKTQNTSIIAVSEATKKDLIDLFDIGPEKITVIYEALPEESKIIPTVEKMEMVKKKYDITKPYFLMVGTKEPRKNYPRQIAAWRQFKQDFNLVIVGKSGWESIEPEEGLIQIGYAKGDELAGLYKGAACLLYCSLAEGFGLPILEAFFHQLPVVTSNVSSLIEISNGVAIEVNPLEIEAIVDGIKQALNTGVGDIQKGVLRLQDFSWDKAGSETIAMYKKALS